MKQRPRRAMILTAALVALVVAVLVVADWGTVRDHLEAWRFQLTTETLRIEPDPGLEGVPAKIKFIEHEPTMHAQVFSYIPLSLLRALANYGGQPVILASEERGGAFTVLQELDNIITADEVRDILWVYHWRLIEQRFPSRTYVIISDAEFFHHERFDGWRAECFQGKRSPESFKELLRAGPSYLPPLPPDRPWRRSSAQAPRLMEDPDYEADTKEEE